MRSYNNYSLMWMWIQTSDTGHSPEFILVPEGGQLTHLIYICRGASSSGGTSLMELNVFNKDNPSGVTKASWTQPAGLDDNTATRVGIPTMHVKTGDVLELRQDSSTNTNSQSTHYAAVIKR